MYFFCNFFVSISLRNLGFTKMVNTIIICHQTSDWFVAFVSCVKVLIQYTDRLQAGMTHYILGLILISQSHIGLADSATTIYQRTINISSGSQSEIWITTITSFINIASWNTALKVTRKSESLLDCAAKCQRKEETESLCNAFKYLNNNNDCYLSKVW